MPKSPYIFLRKKIHNDSSLFSMVVLHNSNFWLYFSICYRGGEMIVSGGSYSIYFLTVEARKVMYGEAETDYVCCVCVTTTTTTLFNCLGNTKQEHPTNLTCCNFICMTNSLSWAIIEIKQPVRITIITTHYYYYYNNLREGYKKTLPMNEVSVKLVVRRCLPERLLLREWWEILEAWRSARFIVPASSFCKGMDDEQIDLPICERLQLTAQFALIVQK